MLEILQDLESAICGTVRLSPVVLVGPGLIFIIAGLFIWLGGLGFRKQLVAVAGAITAGICGFFAIGQNIILAAFVAVFAAVLAMLFERIFITILAAALAALFAIVVLAGPNIENKQLKNVMSPGGRPPQDSAIGVHESAEKMKVYTLDASKKIKNACLQMPLYKWAMIVVLMLVCIVVGFSFWQFTSALCCSVLGTVLIFAGMILLLLNKGSMPVSIISSRASFYMMVFAVMMTFGTTEQLLLCKQHKTSHAVKKSKGPE